MMVKGLALINQHGVQSVSWKPVDYDNEEKIERCALASKAKRVIKSLHCD